jgi:hypothetical protein
MFSDRHRHVKIVLLALLLLALSAYSFLEGPRQLPSIPALLAQMPDPGGTPVKLGFARVIRTVGDGRFLIRVMYGDVVELRIRDVALQRGQVVSVAGRLFPQGYVVAETCTVHRLRWLKQDLSLAAALLMFTILAASCLKSRSVPSAAGKASCRT